MLLLIRGKGSCELVILNTPISVKIFSVGGSTTFVSSLLQILRHQGRVYFYYYRGILQVNYNKLITETH